MQGVTAVTALHCSVYKFTVQGNTALHYAVSNGCFEVASLLLDFCCDVTKQNQAGCTALMLAALVAIETDQQRDVMRKLMSHNETLDARSSLVSFVVEIHALHLASID